MVGADHVRSRRPAGSGYAAVAVDRQSGSGQRQMVGQVESPGPHAIDVSGEGEAFASGCCGGSNPNGFFWLRAKR